MERAEAACGLAQRHRRELCVLMLDIDHFKAVNDRLWPRLRATTY
jgi:diguanylate cyclase (GGDEF)-like protein